MENLLIAAANFIIWGDFEGCRRVRVRMQIGGAGILSSCFLGSLGVSLFVLPFILYGGLHKSLFPTVSSAKWPETFYRWLAMVVISGFKTIRKDHFWAQDAHLRLNDKGS